jgi:hypothetical protein
MRDGSKFTKKPAQNQKPPTAGSMMDGPPKRASLSGKHELSDEIKQSNADIFGIDMNRASTMRKKSKDKDEDDPFGGELLGESQHLSKGIPKQRDEDLLGFDLGGQSTMKKKETLKKSDSQDFGNITRSTRLTKPGEDEQKQETVKMYNEAPIRKSKTNKPGIK